MTIKQHKVSAIVLAGGEGTRLLPLTLTRCKPAVPFGGRYRIVDISISNALASGVSKLFIISQFLADTLNRHIQDTYHTEAQQTKNIELLHPERLGTEAYLGTADAVRKNLKYILQHDSEYFFILSGDQLYSMDLEKMLTFAIEKQADLTIASLPIQETDCTRLGVLRINENHQITDFAEKPKAPERIAQLRSFKNTTSHLGSMGIYLFRREALIHLLKHDLREDFGKHLIPTKMDLGNSYAYPFDGYWEDIGTIGSYHKAHIDLFNHTTGFSLYHTPSPIYTHPTYLPAPRIAQTQLNHAIVCDGSDVYADQIVRSLIGIGTEVGQGSRIHDSVILGNIPSSPISRPVHTRIGQDCEITHTIMDEGAQIGNHVRLINQQKLQTYQDDHLIVKDGIIVVKNNAQIPDHFVF